MVAEMTNAFGSSPFSSRVVGLTPAILQAALSFFAGGDIIAASYARHSTRCDGRHSQGDELFFDRPCARLRAFCRFLSLVDSWFVTQRGFEIVRRRFVGWS